LPQPANTDIPIAKTTMFYVVNVVLLTGKRGRGKKNKTHRINIFSHREKAL